MGQEFINAWHIFVEAQTNTMSGKEILDKLHPAEAAGMILVLLQGDIHEAIYYAEYAYDGAQRCELLPRIILWRKTLELLKTSLD